MKWFFLLWIFLFGLPAALAQVEVDIDAMVQAMKKEYTPSQIVDTLNERAYESRREEGLSEKYATRAMALAQEIGYKKGEGDACVRLGIIAKNQGQYQRAEQFYSKALYVREKFKERWPVISVYNNLGILYRKQGYFSEALEYYKSGWDLVDESVEDKDKSKLLNGIAICYQHLGEYQKALEYNDRDIELREKWSGRLGAANSMLTSGTIYQKMKNYSQAEAKYQESLSIFENLNEPAEIARCHINLGSLYYEQDQFRKSLEYYQKALSRKAELSDDGVAILYRNIGSCYNMLEQPDSALSFYRRSRDIYQSNQNALGLADTEFSFGSFFTGQGQHQKALGHFMESWNILQNNQISDPFLEMNLASRLSDAYTQLGDYGAALQYENRHSSIQDSLNTLSMNAANYKYSYEEERRKNEKIVSDAKFERMRLIYTLSGIIIFLLFAAGLALMALRHRQRKRTMDREIDELLRNQEITASYARIEGQDEERRRVAQDLHDGLGSMLSTIKLYFSTLDSKIDLMRLESREQYNKANTLLDEACEEVRRVAHNMQSGILKKFGLAAQLEDLAETIRNSSRMKVDLITHKLDERLESKLEVNIYRIIQELVGNALKHAKATKMTIQLNRFGEIIHILVEDNGVGFKEEAAMAKGGMGLSGITARVQALKGKINIDSAIGRGTSVSIDLPVHQEAALMDNYKNL